jgi:hypothetical protein
VFSEPEKSIFEQNHQILGKENWLVFSKTARLVGQLSLREKSFIKTSIG